MSRTKTAVGAGLPRTGSAADHGNLFRIPKVWPNGSAVFTIPEANQAGAELGRVFKEGDAWRVLRPVEGGYADMGTAPSQLSGIAMLPQAQASEPPLAAGTKKPSGKAGKRGG